MVFAVAVNAAAGAGCACVCVCGAPKLQRDLGVQHSKTIDAAPFRKMQTGTKKDFHQMPVKQWRTLHCVPATCDTIYRASVHCFIFENRRCAAASAVLVLQM